MMIQNKIIVAPILFVLISVLCLAQGQGDVLPPPGTPPPPVGLPIDTGVLFVAILAILYGARKIIKNN